MTFNNKWTFGAGGANQDLQTTITYGNTVVAKTNSDLFMHFKNTLGNNSFKFYLSANHAVLDIENENNNGIWHLIPVSNNSYCNVNLALGKSSGAVTSAVLELVDDDRGFLPPRMTTAEKNGIGSPAEGLMVYDTTENKMYTYDGSSWEPMW